MCVSVYVSVGQDTHLTRGVKTIIPHDLRIKMLCVLELLVELV